VRVNRDTVPSNTWPRIKSRETIGFCSGSRNHFPYIYLEKVCHHCQFVNQANIDSSKCILEKLYKFRCSRRTDWNDRIYHCFVECSGQLYATRSDASNDFWRITQAILCISWINTLWRIAKKEFLPNLETALLESWQNALICCAGIGRALQHNKLTWMKGSSNCVNNRKNSINIWLFCFI
jgi:hypothetical protein